MKMNNPIGLKVTNTLAEEIRKQFSFEEILCLCCSEFGIFAEFSKQASIKVLSKAQEEITENITRNVIVGDPFSELDKIDSAFDFVVGDFPMGMANSKWRDETKNISFNARRNWLMLLKSLLLLRENGLGLFLIEPAFWSKQWIDFQEKLNDYGFFICAVFNPPEKILFPYTFLQPNLILVSREKVDKLFIAEIENVDSIGLQINNLIKQASANNLNEGIFIPPSDFRDFYNFKITKQIEKLKTQCKEYSNYKLADISSEINLGRNKQEFTEKENSIYIPRVGNSPVIVGLENLRLKHHNYIQVVLDKAIVLNNYLELFFSSELGQLVLKSLYSGSVIPHINKTDLTNVVVPIPPLEEQKLIVKTEKKLSRLTKTIESFKRELSLNPRSASNIQEKVSDLLEQLNLLSDADRILALIRKGESKTLEFKETLSLDVRKKTKEKYIEKAVLKTIVGFLNTDGGILLVGISDNGDILGLSGEISRFHKNIDRFLLHFKNLIKSQIGEEFYPDIGYRIVNICNKNVLLVECAPDSKPCFLEQKEFYVRTNPATDLLEGPKLVEYISRRFKN